MGFAKGDGLGLFIVIKPLLGHAPYYTLRPLMRAYHLNPGRLRAQAINEEGFKVRFILVAERDSQKNNENTIIVCEIASIIFISN